MNKSPSQKEIVQLIVKVQSQKKVRTKIIKTKSKRKISIKVQNEKFCPIPSNSNNNLQINKNILSQPISPQILNKKISLFTIDKTIDENSQLNKMKQDCSISIPHNSRNFQEKYQRQNSRRMSRKIIVSKDKSIKKIYHINHFQINCIKKKQKQTKNILKILDPQSFIVEKQEGKRKKENQKLFKQVKKLTQIGQNTKQIRQNTKQLKQQTKQIKQRMIRAFWTVSHKLVSLFPLQYTECIVLKHKNLLPIYGQVMIKQTRYVVSNEYRQSTLKDLIRQFGPFSESLTQRYLIQIINGVEEMHDKKIAHNRLRTENILYNKQGELVINVVKSSSRPLSQKEKWAQLHEYSPQILFSKSNSNSLSSDIWALGVLLLDMLLNISEFPLILCELHPYNWSQNRLESRSNSIIVDNLRQLYTKSFERFGEFSEREVQIMNKVSNFSQQCKSFINNCLVLNAEQRGGIKSLKFHNFLRR